MEIVNRGFHPVDAVAGVGITAWLVGMALVLGMDEPTAQTAGGVLWAAGVVIATGAAAQAYRAAAIEAD